MSRKELKQAVIDMMNVGYPPSRIDKELRLAPGRAKEIVVENWWGSTPMEDAFEDLWK